MRIRIRSTWQLIVLGIAGALGVAACASGFVREGEYRDQRFAVRMPPTRWIPADIDGAVLVFRAPDLGAAIALRAECARPEPGPLSAVSRHLFFGLTDKRIVLQEQIAVPGGEGVRTRLHARLEERPVDVEGRTLRHGGCLYDFVYVAPPERFAEGAADFAEFARSWRPVFAP